MTKLKLNDILKQLSAVGALLNLIDDESFSHMALNNFKEYLIDAITIGVIRNCLFEPSGDDVES